MLPFQIKICGIRCVEDAVLAVEYGADAIGLNFFRASARYVDSNAARAIVEAVADWHQENTAKRKPKDVGVLPRVAPPKMIGVFVNADVNEVAEIAHALGLDAIQLHGDETTELISRLRDVLKHRGNNSCLIRAIRLDAAADQTIHRAKAIEGVNSEIQRWVEAGIDAVLLDAIVPGVFGGTGKSLDWNMVSQLDRVERIVLAGGLNPENIEDAIRIANIRSVDVASGVESKPGVKDPVKMKTLIETARRVLMGD